MLAAPKHGKYTSDGYKRRLFYMGLELGLISLKGDQRLRVFQNRAPKKIFASKREEVTRGFRQLYTATLRGLYGSRDISHSFRSLSGDKAAAISKASFPHSAI